MKTTLSSVKLFIVDEVSMVSSLNLTYIHMRLDELLVVKSGSMTECPLLW